MDNASAIIHYKAAMAIFRQWFSEGIIGADELAVIETTMAEKYVLPSGSIYRSNA